MRMGYCPPSPRPEVGSEFDAGILGGVRYSYIAIAVVIIAVVVGLVVFMRKRGG